MEWSKPGRKGGISVQKAEEASLTRYIAYYIVCYIRCWRSIQPAESRRCVMRSGNHTKPSRLTSYEMSPRSRPGRTRPGREISVDTFSYFLVVDKVSWPLTKTNKYMSAKYLLSDSALIPFKVVTRETIIPATMPRFPPEGTQ